MPLCDCHQGQTQVHEAVGLPVSPAEQHEAPENGAWGLLSAWEQTFWLEAVPPTTVYLLLLFYPRLIYL